MMLKILDDHDCCVCEFVEIFQASQPSISQHIRKLKDIGLVEEERRGQWTFYSMNKDNSFYPLILQILSLLPQQDEKLKKLRSEEHTSELQSRGHLVCRLLLEKKNKQIVDNITHIK